MSKKIEFSKEGRDKIIKGINKLAKAVISTLGPKGRNVIYEENGEIRSTKDGVTVAKNVVLEEPFENMGASLLKQAATKTADLAGDGTTTSTLLANHIIEEGMRLIDKTSNVVEIKQGIEIATKQIIDNLDKIKEEISSEEQIKQIASVSANNDIEIGKLISLAFNKVGKEGVVHIEESKSSENKLEVVEGMQFDRGYKSHFFVTDNSTMTCTLDNPLILITDKRFNNIKELLPALQAVSQQNLPLLIICDDIDGEALATLIVNKMRGILKVCAVKAPEFGDRKKLVLEDIAILTGGQVISEDKGMDLSDDNFNMSWLGSARAVTINRDQTTIVDGKGNIESTKNRISELKSQIDGAKDAYMKEQLQNRLAKLAGGVAIIHVGGNTETEVKEKKDRVDDALHATKAALEEGIVPGGGVALYRASILAENNSLKELRNSGKQDKTADQLKGIDIVYKACKIPFEQLLDNAGYDKDMIYRLKNSLFINQHNYWLGYNIKSDSQVNMKEGGIIDPVKVTRIALENASAVAGTVLLTECVIVDKPKEEKEPEPSMMY